MAVKVLSHEGDAATKLSALHESMVCAKIAHPNVVRPHDTMDWCSAPSRGAERVCVSTQCCHQSPCKVRFRPSR